MDGSPVQGAGTQRVVDRRPITHVPDANDGAIDLSGVFNFRDLASAQAAGGSLRSRLVYRADGINRCRDTETQMIADLGVRRVLDLRTDRERMADGVFDHPDIVTVHIPMIENLEALADRLDEVDAELMAEFYLTIAADNSGAIALCIAEIIASAADDEPVVVHCTAGKDRTGIVSALVLALAGVDDRHIADDYARSAAAVARLHAWQREREATTRLDELADAGFGPAHQAQLMSADPATIVAFLDGIRRHYGSVEDYLAWGGTDRSELDRVRRVFAA